LDFYDSRDNSIKDHFKIFSAMRLFGIILCNTIFCFAAAQTKMVWWKLSDSNYSSIDGLGWPGERHGAIQRLPDRFKDRVSKANWDQSLESSGLSIRFISNATDIFVRYKLSDSTKTLTKSTARANGVDLYAIDSDGLWHWANGQSTISDSVQYAFNQLRPNDNFHKLGREYQLFFPISNSIKELCIGVPEGSLFKLMPSRVERPVVVYGPSLSMDGDASRPGLAWTNILSRKLDRTVVNLGFSSDGLTEKSMLDCINEIDARIFVFNGILDPNISNLDSIELARTITETVKMIRGKHPVTPILFAEHAGFTNGYLAGDQITLSERFNKTLHAAIGKMKIEGESALYLLTQKELGFDLDEMSDGTHPNDLGMKCYADAYEKKLREIFMEPVGKLKTQIPIRQRRTPAGYDWEARHRSILALNKTEPGKVLLIGNSITHNWGGKPNPKSNSSWEKYIAPYQVRNFGFGADRIENVLWRIYHDEFSGIQPEKIILNIGTNNLRVDSNEVILEGLRFLLQVIKIHQPQAEITLLGFYPRRGYDDRILLINKELRRITRSEKVKFADIGKVLSGKDGLIDESYFTDGLHPNLKGYEALGKQLEELLKK
jgi:lysophospholipase L1-like esterase